MRGLIALAVLTIPSAPSVAGTKVLATKKISFEACVASIQEVATQLGTAPVNIVETTILRVVRFNTNDGSGKSILVTCSKPDEKMVINESW